MKRTDGRALGVFVGAESLFLAELEALPEEGRFFVRRARAEMARGLSGEALFDAPERFAENLRRLCMTYGLAYDKMGLCLPRELFFLYEKEFPAMAREDLRAAVRWDMESNVPFAAGTYWLGFGASENAVTLAALDEAHGRALVEAMAERGLMAEGVAMEPFRFAPRRVGDSLVWRDELASLSAEAARTPWTHGLSMAFFAALRLFYPSMGIEFLPEKERASRARRWRMGGALLLCCTLLTAAALFLSNLWRLSEAEARLDALRQERAMQARDRARMDELMAARRAAEALETPLCALSSARVSWYAVFSCLGASLTDGVYLTTLDAADGALLCGGRASDYARAAGYMERLAADGAALWEPPVLTGLTAEAGQVRFTMRLAFRVERRTP